jgi:hypothetical protein
MLLPPCKNEVVIAERDRRSDRLFGRWFTDKSRTRFQSAPTALRVRIQEQVVTVAAPGLVHPYVTGTVRAGTRIRVRSPVVCVVTKSNDAGSSYL